MRGGDYTASGQNEQGEEQMGQYHYPASITRREYLNPLAFGDGLKLAEFGDSRGGTLLVLTGLLAASNQGAFGDLPVQNDEWLAELELDQMLVVSFYGRWAGNTVAIMGDYWQGDDLADWGYAPGGDELASGGPWGNDKRHWTDISYFGLVLLGMNPEYTDHARQMMASDFAPPRPEGLAA